jgi:hypothetical protein
MSGLTNSRDQTWEKVIETLATDGRLDRFFKTPRHERKAALQLFGKTATRDLGELFRYIQLQDFEGAESFLTSLDSYRSIAMIQILVRSMQCWTETEALAPRGAKTMWKVAHA